jgi:hypothetical protein
MFAKLCSPEGVCGLAALFLMGLEGGARAQSNEAIAEKLFLDGRTLLNAGKVHEACAKFADSQRLDPALGTLMHLALCHEKDHRPATAWSEFTDAVALAQTSGRRDRELFARAHMGALEKQLQKIVIEIQTPVPGTVVKLDSQALPSGIVGAEIPVDPGDHEIEVSAPGKKTWQKDKINLTPGATVTRVQVALEDEPPPPAQRPSVSVAVSAPAVLPPTPGNSGGDAAPSGNGTARAFGFAAGGLGLVLIGIAAYDEATSLSRNSDESKYPATSTARQTVVNEAKTAQTYAIVFGGASLVALGTGLVLVFTAQSDATPRASSSNTLRAMPYVDSHGGGVGIGGAF